MQDLALSAQLEGHARKFREALCRDHSSVEAEDKSKRSGSAVQMGGCEQGRSVLSSRAARLRRRQACRPRMPWLGISSENIRRMSLHPRERLERARSLPLAHHQPCLAVTMADFTVSAVLFDMDGPSSSRE